MADQRAEGLGYYPEDYQNYEDVEDYEEVEGFEDDLDDDEGIEAYEEDDDDDEVFELEDDDDDESFEAYEDDDDDDEAYELEDDDDDESFEDDDDDDEAFEEGYAEVEAIGESDEESAAERSRRSRRRRRSRTLWLMRRRQARRRAAARARAKQRITARRARATQKRLSRQLGRIRVKSRVGLRPTGRAKGGNVVIATMPNGRQAKLFLNPPMATRKDVNRLTGRIGANAAKQARAYRAQGKTIAKLKTAQGAAIKSLTAQQVKSSKELTKQITAREAKFDKRFSKELRNQKMAQSRHRRQTLGEVRRQQQRSMWNNILLASSYPLYSAYGVKSDPFATNNLILTANLGFWMLADDVASRFLGRKGKYAKTWNRGANLWSIAAPVANVATAYYLMKDKQHKRFLTGVVEVKNDISPKIVDLTSVVGSDYKDEFITITDLPAVATIQSTTATLSGVKAEVNSGKLELTLLGATGTDTAEVAYAVDTQKPAS